MISREVPRDILVERLSVRRICRQCVRAWHVQFSPPPSLQRCQCGGELYQRSDDQPETVRQRLDVYEAQTSPLKDWYRQRGLLVAVDGNQPIEAVFADILSALGVSR